MNVLFILLFLISPILLVIGLIKPTMFSKLLKGDVTRKKIAKLFGGASVLFLILAVMTSGSSSKVTQSDTEKTIEEDQSVDTAKKQIEYNIVERWEIPNGGEGKRIVISEDIVNEQDMRVLGERLKEDTKDDRNAIVNVFTDKKAAEIQGDFADLSDEDLEWAEKHYVGQYIRNPNSNYNTFSIYLSGSGDPAGYIDIEY